MNSLCGRWDSNCDIGIDVIRKVNHELKAARPLSGVWV